MRTFFLLSVGDILKSQVLSFSRLTLLDAPPAKRDLPTAAPLREPSCFNYYLLGPLYDGPSSARIIHALPRAVDVSKFGFVCFFFDPRAGRFTTSMDRFPSCLLTRYFEQNYDV